MTGRVRGGCGCHVIGPQPQPRPQPTRPTTSTPRLISLFSFSSLLPYPSHLVPPARLRPELRSHVQGVVSPDLRCFPPLAWRGMLGALLFSKLDLLVRVRSMRRSPP